MANLTGRLLLDGALAAGPAPVRPGRSGRCPPAVRWAGTPCRRGASAAEAELRAPDSRQRIQAGHVLRGEREPVRTEVR